MEQKIKAVLFDLDGTLLPLDTYAFIKQYMQDISEYSVQQGYLGPVENCISVIWEACKFVWESTDTTTTNCDVFWRAFTSLTGEKYLESYERVFHDYYTERYPSLGEQYGKNPYSLKAVEIVKQQGKKLILATNPVFPLIAIEERMRWAGMPINSFELITSYENMNLAKPHQGYYEQILRFLNLSPEECIMVGNDVRDDILPSMAVGMQSYFLTDFALHADELPEHIPSGGFPDLCTWLQTL